MDRRRPRLLPQTPPRRQQRSARSPPFAPSGRGLSVGLTLAPFQGLRHALDHRLPLILTPTLALPCSGSHG